MKYLLLDTNIYLHFIDFEQIKWSDIIDTSEGITIVVPQIVISEIDKIKDSDKTKVKKRAKVISKKFGEVFLYSKPLNINVIKCESPAANQFDGKKFNELVNDDSIILSALNFVRDNSCEIIVISSDNTLLIKAKDNGLEFLELPEKYKLIEELSEVEIELAKAKQELQEIKNRQSNPVLSFDDESYLLSFMMPLALDIDEEVNRKIDKEKKECPYAEINNSDYDTNMNRNSIVSAYLNNRTPEQIKKYNKELDEYFAEYELYTRFTTENEILSSYLKEIRFRLTNSGTSSTGELNIFIRFPENLKLYGRDSKKHEWIETPFKLIKDSPLSRRTLKLASGLTNKEKFFCWDLLKPIKNEYHIQDSALVHNMTYLLDLGDSVYIDTRFCGNFHIDYVIIDANLPKPISGKLNVTVR